MSGSLPAAIDARHLTHRYGQFTAVDGVTLQVRPGETMGLLGPNGAGKTTMVRMLTTSTPVRDGELRVFGMDARHQTNDIRANIGCVLQQLSIEPALTGRSGSIRRWTPSTCSTWPTGLRRPTPAAWYGGWKWLRLWSIDHHCSYSTSRPSDWIRSRATAFGRRCASCRPSSA